MKNLICDVSPRTMGKLDRTMTVPSQLPAASQARLVWCVKSDSLLRWGELGDIWWRFYTNERAEFGL